MWFRDSEVRSDGPREKASGPEQAETQPDCEGFCALAYGRWAEPCVFGARRKARKILLLVRHGRWWSLREMAGFYVPAGEDGIHVSGNGSGDPLSVDTYSRRSCHRSSSRDVRCSPSPGGSSRTECRFFPMRSARSQRINEGGGWGTYRGSGMKPLPPYFLAIHSSTGFSGPFTRAAAI